MYQNHYKKESTVILACIILIILFIILIWIIKKLLNKIELFGNRSSSGNSKRDKMKRIYKSDEVLDPDETVMNNPNEDECDDPDGDCGRDPDS